MEGSFKLRTEIVDANFGVDVFMGSCSGKTHSLSWMLGFGLRVAESSYTAPNAGLALEQLHGIRNKLLKLLKGTSLTPAMILQGFTPARTFSEAEILRIIREAQETRCIIDGRLLKDIISDHPYRFDLVEFVASTLESISEAIESLERCILRPVITYCGIPWARRIWHLLHGSHPPKSECSVLNRQAFGNA